MAASAKRTWPNNDALSVKVILINWSGFSAGAASNTNYRYLCTGLKLMCNWKLTRSLKCESNATVNVEFCKTIHPGRCPRLVTKTSAVVQTFTLHLFVFLWFMPYSNKRLENHSEKHLNYLHISAAPGTERGSNFPNRRQPHYYFSLTERGGGKKRVHTWVLMDSDPLACPKLLCQLSFPLMPWQAGSPQVFPLNHPSSKSDPYCSMSSP